METIKRNPRTAWREHSGIVLVITPDDSKIHKLNETGTFVWKMAGENGLSREKVLDAMVDEFETRRSDAEKDLEKFLKKVVEKGIMTKELP